MTDVGCINAMGGKGRMISYFLLVLVLVLVLVSCRYRFSVVDFRFRFDGDCAMRRRGLLVVSCCAVCGCVNEGGQWTMMMAMMMVVIEFRGRDLCNYCADCSCKGVDDRGRWVNVNVERELLLGRAGAIELDGWMDGWMDGRNADADLYSVLFSISLFSRPPLDPWRYFDP